MPRLIITVVMLISIVAGCTELQKTPMPVRAGVPPLISAADATIIDGRCERLSPFMLNADDCVYGADVPVPQDAVYEDGVPLPGPEFQREAMEWSYRASQSLEDGVAKLRRCCSECAMPLKELHLAKACTSNRGGQEWPYDEKEFVGDPVVVSLREASLKRGVSTWDGYLALQYTQGARSLTVFLGVRRTTKGPRLNGEMYFGFLDMKTFRWMASWLPGTSLEDDRKASAELAGRHVNSELWHWASDKQSPVSCWQFSYVIDLPDVFDHTRINEIWIGESNGEKSSLKESGPGTLLFVGTCGVVRPVHIKVDPWGDVWPSGGLVEIPVTIKDISVGNDVDLSKVNSICAEVNGLPTEFSRLPDRIRSYRCPSIEMYGFTLLPTSSYRCDVWFKDGWLDSVKIIPIATGAK